MRKGNVNIGGIIVAIVTIFLIIMMINMSFSAVDNNVPESERDENSVLGSSWVVIDSGEGANEDKQGVISVIIFIITIVILISIFLGITKLIKNKF